MHWRLASIADINDWKCRGDLSLLDRPAGTVLLSRRSRRPRPDEWWIRATAEACESMARRGMSMICGGGILHLDYARWAAHRSGDAVLVELNRGRKTGVGDTPEWNRLTVTPETGRMKKAESMALRDSIIIDMADEIVAVSIRPKGNMERLCVEALEKGRRVSTFIPPDSSSVSKGNLNLLEAGATGIKVPDRQAPSKKKRPAGAVTYPKGQLSISFYGNRVLEIPPEGFLWHFTRECPGPWPDQTWDDYFEALLEGRDGAAHEAEDSLERILEKGVIKGQGRMIRGGHRVVCWSELSPVELAREPQYRPALGRWNFKPCAVGVRRAVMSGMGARPVIYGDDEAYNDIPDAKKYLYQATGGGARKWTGEKEWRTKGDFNLGALDPADITVLVETPEHADRIGKIGNFGIFSINKSRRER